MPRTEAWFMKELNVVDWASQQPSISGTWQLKLNIKRQILRTTKSSHGERTYQKTSVAHALERLIGLNDAGDLSGSHIISWLKYAEVGHQRPKSSWRQRWKANMHLLTRGDLVAPVWKHRNTTALLLFQSNRNLNHYFIFPFLCKEEQVVSHNFKSFKCGFVFVNIWVWPDGFRDVLSASVLHN